MGHNTYKNGFIEDGLGAPGWQEVILNSRQVQTEVYKTGERFITKAIALYESVDKEEDTPPILYSAHFGIRVVARALVEAIQVYNDDPTAEWVEFGAHAGGKTRVLRYRIFGHTADAMEAEAGGEDLIDDVT